MSHATSTIAPAILERAKYWATAPVFDAQTRSEIAQLIETGNAKELDDRFYRDLEFGTGGLRGILGAGTARMNYYNIRKAACALAQYVQAAYPNKSNSIAIAYDSRRFSREFAQATAEVMAAHRIKTYITKELRPVPMLSFFVRHFGCAAGVCVTASHNPPEYNGFKVYWTTGGQVVPPHDAEIIRRYNGITDYESIPSMPFEQAERAGLVEFIGEDIDRLYFDKVAGLSLRAQGRNDFKIVYTPLHGSGAYPVSECLRRFGFEKVWVVPEQEKPNGNFPTVKYPNPEEPDALKMAVDLAKKVGADLVLGTDPDSDRVGIVIREGNDYLFLNGNQIGCLLIEYYLSALKETGKMPPNALVIKTIVTTELQDAIAKHYGADVEDTLTGFKWMCQLIEDYESGKRLPYKKYVCGGEESFGYLFDSFVRDKDGVISCCMAAEMVAYYKSKGLGVTQVLDQIFRRHGVYQESLKTVTLPGKEGAEKINAMMQRLRANPPREIGGVSVEILRDIKTSAEYSFEAGKMQKIRSLTLSSSDVLQFILKDGSKVSARPSGTEPKIKFYVSVREAVRPDISDAELRKVKQNCLQRIAAIESQFTQLAQS
jgi:phosphoglucomutase